MSTPTPSQMNATHFCFPPSKQGFLEGAEATVKKPSDNVRRSSTSKLLTQHGERRKSTYSSPTTATSPYHLRLSGEFSRVVYPPSEPVLARCLKPLQQSNSPFCDFSEVPCLPTKTVPAETAKPSLKSDSLAVPDQKNRFSTCEKSRKKTRFR